MKKWLASALLGAVAVTGVAGDALASGGGAAHGQAAPGGPVDHSANWNYLWHHVLLDLYAIGIVFALITIWFMVSYRRRSADQVGDMPHMDISKILGWSLVPAFIFMADDFYLAANGWKLWTEQRTVPEGALEVKGTAMMYNWDFEYENGAVSSLDLYVPRGVPVVVRSTSDDVVHSFFLADYRIKEDVMPGRVTFVWFLPKEDSVLTCTEYCGTGHSDMYGMVKVLEPSKFDEWLAENAS